MASVHYSEQSILDEVRTWDPERRRALARQILATAEPPRVATPPRRLQPESLLGFLRTEAPVPTDEECRRIVEEERLKKHQ